MDFEQNIIRLLNGILGDSKRGYASSGGWIEYNCPCCGEELGHPDGKYNLAISLEELYGHCWKCGYSAKLSRLIKKYGSAEDVAEYKTELNNLKESRSFTFGGGLNDAVEELDPIVELSLPEGFKLINKEDSHCHEALNYLYGRGVDDFLIKKYNIGYCGRGCGIYSERIIIPSYDMFGDLNYWFGRDYSGKNKQWSKLNPKTDKKTIVFNEYYVNWYEPITLVEGPFDHIAVPNSIPLLGKSIDQDSMVYRTIKEKCHSTINILLDSDAVDDAYRMYKFLNKTMRGNIRIIECPEGYDASDYHNDYGRQGIVQLLRSAHKLDGYTLAMVKEKKRHF